MAKKNISNEPVNANLPEGFDNAKPEIAGAYFRFVEGSILQGILLGRFEKPGHDADAFIYQVRATKPCMAFIRNPEADENTGDAEKYVTAEVPVGTIVSIDEKASLKGLKVLAMDDTVEWEIFVRVNERVKLAGGKTFWDCVVGKKSHKLPF